MQTVIATGPLLATAALRAFSSPYGILSTVFTLTPAEPVVLQVPS